MKLATQCIWFSVVSILYACNEETISTQNTRELVGNWFVIEVTGGIAGVAERYSSNQILWEIRDKSLTISYPSGFGAYMPAIGTHPYKTCEIVEGTLLNFNHLDYRVELVTTDTLILQQWVSDGFRYVLNK